MKKIYYCVGVLLALAGGFAAGVRGSARSPGGEVTAADTVVITDTVVIDRPVEVARTRIVTRTVAVAADSVAVTGDTALVRLPAQSLTYEGQGYTAYVSGIEPRLDSLRLYTTSSVITRSAAPQRRLRWGIGVSAGYAATPRGLQPYVGIGVTYTLLGFK